MLVHFVTGTKGWDFKVPGSVNLHLWIPDRAAKSSGESLWSDFWGAQREVHLSVSGGVVICASGRAVALGETPQMFQSHIPVHQEIYFAETLQDACVCMCEASKISFFNFFFSATGWEYLHPSSLRTVWQLSKHQVFPYLPVSCSGVPIFPCSWSSLCLSLQGTHFSHFSMPSASH